MIDFFNTLSDLLKSDLVKGNAKAIVIFLVIIIVITSYLTWIICTKFFYQIKLNQVADKEARFVSFQERIQALEKENQVLKEKMAEYEFAKAIVHQGTPSFEDSALDKFRRKEK